MTKPTAPTVEAYSTTPSPTATIQTTTEMPQTTSTMSTTTVKLIPYSEETGPFPSLSITQAALIKVLEEAVKIEHRALRDEKGSKLVKSYKSSNEREDTLRTNLLPFEGL